MLDATSNSGGGGGGGGGGSGGGGGGGGGCRAQQPPRVGTEQLGDDVGALLGSAGSALGANQKSILAGRNAVVGAGAVPSAPGLSLNRNNNNNDSTGLPRPRHRVVAGDGRPCEGSTGMPGSVEGGDALVNAWVPESAGETVLETTETTGTTETTETSPASSRSPRCESSQQVQRRAAQRRAAPTAKERRGLRKFRLPGHKPKAACPQEVPGPQ